MTDTDKLNEVHERMRRVETRLTRLVEAMGVDAGGKRPLWNDGIIVIPSLACSLHQIVATVPTDWSDEKLIEVQFNGQEVMSFYMP